MNLIMVDSNVLIDIFSDDPVWYQWSSQTLERYSENCQFVINPVIYAEISIAFERMETLEEILSDQLFVRTPIPMEAAFFAAKAFIKYRKNKGNRLTVLPDFFIGAHAFIKKMALITRDTSRYETYFPELELICP